MRIAYFDCFAGASGDMILGALVDAGLDPDALKSQLAGLRLTHYNLQVQAVIKKGIGGSQVLVAVDQDHHQHHQRHLADIREIIETSDLASSVQQKSIQIFTRLAEAEAKVHRTNIENIHFHEVGAIDAIIDVVGAVSGLELLKIEALFCSPLHVGTGTVECAHGTLPVPAPATAELIKGLPVYSTGAAGELLTPTGAAILTTLASEFGPMPAMKIGTIGYGAGTAETSIPNLLRVVIGEAALKAAEYDMEQAAVIETNIDDMTPQIYDHLIQRLLQLGVLDVFLTQVLMKKNRPGTLVTVICPSDMVGEVSDVLMRETTTIGLRWRIDNRIKAQRAIKKIRTTYGAVRIKVASAGDRIINIAPEYEDCKRLAIARNVPLKDVMAAAQTAARQEGRKK